MVSSYLGAMEFKDSFKQFSLPHHGAKQLPIPPHDEHLDHNGRESADCAADAGSHAPDFVCRRGGNKELQPVGETQSAMGRPFGTRSVPVGS